MIAVVEEFLRVAGNCDLPAMEAMMADKGNLGIIGLRDIVWKATFKTIDRQNETLKLLQDLRIRLITKYTSNKHGI